MPFCDPAVAQEMLWWHRRCSADRKPKLRRPHMLGRLLVVTLVGLAAWKYRDSLREYAQGNTGPAREKVDGLLLAAQQRSETLLDRAKEHISSRLEEAREKLSARTPDANHRAIPTE
jgi:hypothetical protein